ncbi:MAG TPA: ribosomal protein L7/L12 [Longimicrobium sp.]|jgi:large subunit ribosomal protein L7/L12
MRTFVRYNRDGVVQATVTVAQLPRGREHPWVDLKEGESAVEVTLPAGAGFNDLRQIHRGRVDVRTKQVMPFVDAGKKKARKAKGKEKAGQPKPLPRGKYSVILYAVGERVVDVVALVREVAGLGLKEARALVAGVPRVVKDGLPKDQAATIRARFQEQGATAEVRVRLRSPDDLPPPPVEIPLPGGTTPAPPPTFPGGITPPPPKTNPYETPPIIVKPEDPTF